MQNLVEQYTNDETTNDHGVVAVEYVVVAGLIAAGVGLVFGGPVWTALRDALESHLV